MATGFEQLWRLFPAPLSPFGAGSGHHSKRSDFSAVVGWKSARGVRQKVAGHAPKIHGPGPRAVAGEDAVEPIRKGTAVDQQLAMLLDTRRLTFSMEILHTMRM